MLQRFDFIELLEPRELFTFANWSSIGPAIALVPQSAGQLASVSVVNFGSTVYTGPLNVTNTLNRIRADDGPDRSDDGIVYTSPQASGLPVDGTYYEFTVEPATGTDRDFTTISSPGPMRILLATGGDCYFTGDHYSTFTAVYIPGSTSPVIGSFSLSPTSVTVGTSTTLTATGVTESGGTISSVKFYLESNGTTGLQTSTDTLVGTGTQSGTTWSISAATSSLTAGTYTYYAVATDSTGNASSVSSATLTVTSGTAGSPTIGSLVANPASVTIGTSTTLAAANVAETGGTISSVKFYLESNSTSGLQIGSDTLVGTGTQSGTTWTITAATTGFAAGTYTYYAVATDSNSVSSATSSTTLGVTSATTAGVLAAWDVSAQTSFGTQGLVANQVATGITDSLGLTRGSGVLASGSASSASWGGTNWQSTSAAGITGNDFVTFGVTVAASSVASFSTIDMYAKRSGTGPPNGYWQYQVNGGTWTLIGDYAADFASSAAAIPQISLGGISALQNLAAGTVVDFRVVPYGTTNTASTWYIANQTGEDLSIGGSVSTVVAAAPLVLTSSTNYLKLDADGLHVDIWNNISGTGTPAQSVLLSQITTMTVNGPPAGDNLTVDFSAGDPLVSSGISYNGTAAATNSLNVIGTSGNDAVSVGASAVTFGSIPIAYSNLTAITFNGGAGTDTLTQTAQPGGGATLVFGSSTALDTLNVSSGTFAFPAAPTNAGSTILLNTLSIGSSAKVSIPNPGANSDPSVLVLNNLTLAGSAGNWLGALDVTGNDMIVQSGVLTTIVNQLAGGIVSSAAVSDVSHLHTLGVILNSDSFGNAVYSNTSTIGTFDGQSPSTTSVLVRYTIYGDANLDGTVDGSDYTLIDAGFHNSSTGWLNGDYNYDGSINGSDYTLMDNAFNLQGTSTAALVAASIAPTQSTSATLIASANSNDEMLHKKHRSHLSWAAGL